MKRLTASARSPNFSPRVPFFWRRLYKKKAFLVPSSSSVSLSRFSRLSVVVVVVVVVVLLVSFLFFFFVVVSGIAFFFVSTFSKN
tara:strand:- start:525 stop:779 length:255 start_codon:yes stop_codon:yes gene_type:complete